MQTTPHSKKHRVQLEAGILDININQATTSLSSSCDFASRENPNRGFLFVSRLLGKHIPVKPSTMTATYDQLLQQLYFAEDEKLLCLALSETATCLGAGVYSKIKGKYPDLDTYFQQTTRYACANDFMLSFKEEHSHSTEHLIHYPKDSELYASRTTLLLVDDEMSTGKTLLNLLLALEPKLPKLKRVILCSLTNWMPTASYSKIEATFPRLKIEFPALLYGTFSFEQHSTFQPKNPIPKLDITQNFCDQIQRLESRIGYTSDTRLRLEASQRCLQLSTKLPTTQPILVLGTGEFAYAPYLLACELEDRGFSVWFQTTTRSPILFGNAIQSKRTFKDNYNQGIDNYLYNCLPNEYSHIVVCTETLSGIKLDTVTEDVTTLYYSKLNSNKKETSA